MLDNKKKLKLITFSRNWLTVPNMIFCSFMAMYAMYTEKGLVSLWVGLTFLNLIIYWMNTVTIKLLETTEKLSSEKESDSQRQQKIDKLYGRD